MRSANAYVSSQYNGPGVKIARVTVMMLNHSPGEVVNLMMKMKREAHEGERIEAVREDRMQVVL